MARLRRPDEHDLAAPAEIALSGRGRTSELGDDLGLPQLAMLRQLIQDPAMTGVQFRTSSVDAELLHLVEAVEYSR